MDATTLVFSLGHALSANELTFGFTLVLLGVFLLAVPFHVLRATERSIAFARSAPAVLATVAIVGVLCQLFATLQAFDTSARDASLPSLVEGLRTAAAMGLFGLSLAFVLRIYQALVPPLAAMAGLGDVSPRAGEDPLALAVESPAVERLDAEPLAALERHLIGEIQKLSTTLENQVEETRCESQQAYEELGARFDALGAQVRDTSAQALHPDRTKDQEEEEQPARRFQLRIAVDFESGGQSGQGTLVDLSSSGALIEQVDRQPSPGAFVEICYRLDGEDKPTLLYGKVARATEHGFAVEFVEPGTARPAPPSAAGEPQESQ
ncbi:MAG: PilZ domain-containing protein [Myxococcota bacterium]